MGKAKFWPPRAQKPLNGFRWNMEYITRSRICLHRQIHVALRQRGWSGRTREKKHMLWFLRKYILNFFCFILWLAPSPHKWTDFDDLYVIRRVSGRMCLLGVTFILLPILGVKSPKTPILGLNRHLFIRKLNAQNIKICILSKLLRRLQPNFAQWQRPPNTLRGWSQHA